MYRSQSLDCSRENTIHQRKYARYDRVLGRKWFMSAPEHVHYKHVPGMHIMERYASIYPDRFGPDRVVGDWHFDPQRGENVRAS